MMKIVHISYVSKKLTSYISIIKGIFKKTTCRRPLWRKSWLTYAGIKIPAKIRGWVSIVNHAG